MSTQLPVRAKFINLADLYRSQESFALQQAKDSMGSGNPAAGTDKQPAGSTICPHCGRHHKLGTVCFNMKSLPTSLVTKGTFVSAGGGNPYHHQDNGKFCLNPNTDANEMKDVEEAQAYVDKMRQRNTRAKLTQQDAPQTVKEFPSSLRPAGVDKLLNSKKEEEPDSVDKKTAQGQKKLEELSTNVAQGNNFLSRLRNWQKKYGV